MIDREQMLGQMREELDRDWYSAGWQSGMRTEARFARDEAERMVTFEIEHWQIRRAFKIILGWVKQAEADGVELLEYIELKNGFKQEARKRNQQLEALNHQAEDNWSWIEVESDRIGRHKIPVVELDLSPTSEDRVPYFLVGGIASGIEQNINLAGALALMGHRVIVATYPEQSTADCPDDWVKRLEGDKTFSLHAEVMKEVIAEMGLERVNLMGFSMGGGIALEMATDQDFGRIMDLIVLDPVGLEARGLLRMGWNYFVQQGLATGGSAMTRAKLLWNQRKRNKVKQGMFSADVEILRRQQFDAERLALIHPAGNFQVWIGSSSPLTNQNKITEMLLEAEVLRSMGQKNHSALKIIRVERADHTFPLANSMGLVRIMEKESTNTSKVIDVSAKDLEDSVAWWIFLGILHEELGIEGDLS